MTEEYEDGVEPIAVVGLACRVPGARTPERFWHNMRAGVDSISRFTTAELLASGVDADTLADPDYVPASGFLDDADRFDAEFFGFTPAEAETMDPQQRQLCETAWAAMEDAGHDPARFPGDVAVFAGAFMTKYLVSNLSTSARFQRSPMAPLARMFNDKDFLATRLSHLLDLTGPAYTVQTACSTSLAATHLACQSLLSYECDAALVGGVTVNVPLRAGYPVADSGLFSADGQCRPFDERAGGTVPGSGVVVVLLRRLSDALADRDHVYAVIRGSAVNNDGALKAGYAAPSVDGQLRVITSALAVGGVDPATIGYVEAHGTATQVGDPIEVTALTQAYAGAEVGSCALGSVKANIGHLDAAAGLAGLLRAALALHHDEIPPNANFTAPNPELRLAETPFYVPSAARDWPKADHPRRAAVSSFGVGGTNAHVVLEAAPAAAVERAEARQLQLIPVSARTRAAADAVTERLASALDAAPPPLSDVAFTLQAGRRAFAVRRFAVCADAADAVRALRGDDPGRLVTKVAPDGPHEAVFTFPGGGMQHPDMGLDIYRSEPVFRAEVDRCAEILLPRLGFDLRRLMFPSAFTPLPGRELAGGAATMGRDQGAGVVSSLFVTEYALARQLMAWGVRPAAMLGHSLGEYVAACLAGVFTLEGALEITLARGELFAAMPPGRMLVVGLPEAEVIPLLSERVSVSAVNAPAMTVVAGPDADIAALLKDLRARDVDCRKVSVPVASHSWMVEPYLAEFTAKIADLPLSAPTIPVVSSVTGTWITAAEATDPKYWARHLRQPVRFADGVRQVLAEPGRVLLEVGPGRALTALAAAQQLAPTPIAVATMGLPRDALPDLAHLVTAVGRLWQCGVDVDWVAFHGDADPRRVPLPTYPFQGERHWVEPGGPVVREQATEPVIDLPEVDLDLDGFVAPRTDRERQVAAIWCDLLGLERVSVDDDFFDLGAHSLMVTQVTRQLRRMGATELSARDVLLAGTVEGMAALVDRALGLVPAVATSTGVVLADEVLLDEAITAEGLAPVDPSRPGTVLLTGATGFVGAFLCAELLGSTDATVLCLVRSADEREGLERVRANLDSYGLRSTWGTRLAVVSGDLSRPRLGLTEASFADLAERVDTIHHCGAWVNFVRPYRALKAANVLGTQEILRLATTHKLKPVHHVSTLAVLAGAMREDVERIDENDPLPPAIGHDTAYSQSKWVAEGLVRLARERGVPVSVYRAGGVLADSRSGASNRDDYVTKVIQGCVQLGLAPEREYELSVGTVDHLARLVVGLSTSPTALGRTFHTIDPRPLPWNAIFDRIREFGYPVRGVPFDEWRAALIDQVDQDGDDNALAPLMAMLGDTPDRKMPEIGCGNVFDVLGEAGAPELDRAYFDRMLRFFVRGKLLPPVVAADLTGGS
ncbi:type I polyketide synthase [Actinokineospora xionganensis]|uniref:Thioester reductase domain-containing protein n=1 Tax=Actinokineospora xionganensis TaxID=2684470 RepID=A0ABR7L654_9PSEU|nr:type I polyketide synthase [Actinokineospora xionganensis]MBC6447904.1 thioester reductase domain-containing protein [Actinokineospora xionganensis]